MESNKDTSYKHFRDQLLKNPEFLEEYNRLYTDYLLLRTWLRIENFFRKIFRVKS